jgi:GNAT superfamily N-acetyltransferase
VIVRNRADNDLDDCERIAHEVHESDSYPLYLMDDMRRFVEVPDAYGAWVAEIAGEVVGQVTLKPRASDVVMELARTTTGLPDEQLAVVSRFFVSPAARRHGVGRALLSAATKEAAGRGLVPILDVSTNYRAAIALYEALGWSRAGTVALHLRDGRLLDEFVYVGPH